MNCELSCFPLCGIHKSDCYTAPAAGYRSWGTGVLATVGDHGNIWASSSRAAESYQSTGLYLSSENSFPLDAIPRAFGFSVRCVQHLQGEVAFLWQSSQDGFAFYSCLALYRGFTPIQTAGSPPHPTNKLNVVLPCTLPRISSSVQTGCGSAMPK